MNRRYLLVMLAVCLLVGSVQAWGADFGAWDYRKEITINNTGANLTNYQVLFTVNRSAGTDSGSTVYLNGKCESDYDDIRFTTSDENTLCDYWIESNSSTVASIWVEVPSIPNSTAYGSTTGYLYYNNSGASAVSNGDNTFQFFDDFPGSSLDTSKWDVVSGAGSTSVSGSILTVTGVKNLNCKSIFTIPVSWMAYFKVDAETTGKNFYIGSIDFVNNVPIGGSEDGAYYTQENNNKYWRTTHHGSFTNTARSTSFTSYHKIEFALNGTNAQYIVDNGTPVTVSTNIPTDNQSFIIYDVNTGGVVYCDWVACRKYTATEPTVSAWGSEEEALIGSIAVDFSGVPQSGYVPLTVYFTDASIGYNVTIDTWSWSFGDTTPNSTSQNPAHTYTTSGLYTVGLTATNTSFAKTNTTTKVAYINATVNLDAPNADFTITETCGDIGDTFYFIDFSTGGGLYAWNWSFGDGAYSELRNPTHQYASNGTYDVGLTVWGAYGNDTLTRSNLITVPCGAPTPTPTPTPTGNVTPTPTITFPVVENVTVANTTYIFSPDRDLVPFPVWLLILIVTIAFFVHSIMIARFADITAILSTIFSGVIAWLSNMITFTNIEVHEILGNVTIQPVQYVIHPPWLVYTMLIFFFVSIINVIRVWYVTYLRQPRQEV